jgi:hypothetical protein
MKSIICKFVGHKNNKYQIRLEHDRTISLLFKCSRCGKNTLHSHVTYTNNPMTEQAILFNKIIEEYLIELTIKELQRNNYGTS